MGRANLIVSVGADQHDVANFRLGDQVLEKLKRCRIEPLQIVEEERERMLGPSEDSEKPSEHRLEASLCFLGWNICYGWLSSDDEFELGDKIRYKLAV
ncbi:MAG TPA: hypothetical protein VN325_42230 [Steroidobacteraceae bacterium]|nr:hypothetical protein [Steroidobacteraceae bacterium]